MAVSTLPRCQEQDPYLTASPFPGHAPPPPLLGKVDLESPLVSNRTLQADSMRLSCCQGAGPEVRA